MEASLAGRATGDAGATQGTSVKIVPGFTEAESAVIAETQAALQSENFKKLQEFARTGTEGQVTIAGRTVFYVPDLPPRYSGMTMTSPIHGDEGFVIGPDALTSPMETTKTFLQEIYRLRMGQSASGISGAGVADQTQAAHAFADRAYGALMP